jgi:hypothetical protein
MVESGSRVQVIKHTRGTHLSYGYKGVDFCSCPSKNFTMYRVGEVIIINLQLINKCFSLVQEV